MPKSEEGTRLDDLEQRVKALARLAMELNELRAEVGKLKIEAEEMREE